MKRWACTAGICEGYHAWIRSGCPGNRMYRVVIQWAYTLMLQRLSADIDWSVETVAKSDGRKLVGHN